MRERLRIVQGALSVDSVLGHGTEITAEVPLSENAVAIDAS
jgi:signal transduction histidine kinase